MTARDTGAEQRIKDTAKRIFFAEGRLTATTQDIADAAGVSRTLVHYYFRSVDALINQVYKEALDELSGRLDSVMATDLPFKVKIENFIELFLSVAIEYPYQETFLIKEINTVDNMFATPEMQKKNEIFMEQVQAEMDAGNIEKMNPLHFMMNLFALMSYPLLMRPMLMKMFTLSDYQFKQLVNERKQLIFKMIFR